MRHPKFITSEFQVPQQKHLLFHQITGGPPRYGTDREICRSCAKACERISSSEPGLEQLITVGTMQSLVQLGDKNMFFLKIGEGSWI